MTEQLKSGLWYRCREFVTEQSAGEWDDKTIADDADKMMAFVNRERADMLEALKAARDHTNAIQHSQETRLNDIYDILSAAITKATDEFEGQVSI